MSGAFGGRKRVRVSDSLELEFKLPCKDWELNLGLLQEQQVLLSAESAVQSP